MNKPETARRIAQDLLDTFLPGAVAMLAEETPLPCHAEWADLEVHVFHVPEGKNTKCVRLLLNHLHQDPFSDEDTIIVYPHSAKATRQHYGHVSPEPRATFHDREVFLD